MKKETFLKSYIGLSVLYLALLLSGQDNISWFVKPFLIPFLLLGVHFSSNFLSKKKLLMALSFSWIADILVLFPDEHQMYFGIGLLAYLSSFVVYIITFSKQIKIKNKKNKAIFWIGATVIIVYVLTMLSILLPNLGQLKIPIFIYALVISTMLLFALKCFILWKAPANWQVLLGAILLMISNSILAFDKLHSPLIQGSFLIMITYLLGQYLIVKGILNLNKKN